MPWMRSRVFVGIGFLGAVCSALACSAGSGGGGAGPAGDGPASLSLAGETFPIDFNGEAVFDIGAGGPAESAGFAVMLFTGSPIDSPTDGELLIEAAGLRVIPRAGGPAATTGSITVSARIADGGSTSPCTSGEDIGSFAVAYDEAGVSVSTTALPLPSASLGHAATGQLTLCLMCSGDFDATLTIDRLSVRFGSAAEPELEVSFPESGDELMVVADPEAGAELVFRGARSEDGLGVSLSGFEFRTEEGVTEVRCDAEGRPVEATHGDLRITAAYNTDDTLSYELTDGDELLVSGTEPLPDDLLAEAAPTHRARHQLASCKPPATRLDDDELEGEIEACKRRVRREAVEETLSTHGYTRSDLPLASLEAHPLYECLHSDTTSETMVRSTCVMQVLHHRTYERIYQGCIYRTYPARYCRNVALITYVSTAYYDVLMKMGIEGLALTYWDRTECGCETDAKCPESLVCEDGQCVPKCRYPADCPEGRKVCQRNGHCVAETPEEEEEPPSDDEDEIPDTPETPDTGDFECPVPDGAERMQSVDADGRSSEFYWLDGVGYVGPYLLWWDAAMTRQRDQTCYDSEAKRHGWSRQWFENGKLRLEIEYQHGQYHGVYREWHPGGEHKKREARYVNNKLEGLEQIWHSNGERRYEIEYTAGVKNGAFREFWDNGERKLETNFVDGVEHGTLRRFDETGTLTVTCVVENGVTISCTEP